MNPDYNLLRRHGWSEAKIANLQRIYQASIAQLGERSAWQKFTDDLAALVGAVAGVLIFLVLPVWAFGEFIKQVLLR